MHRIDLYLTEVPPSLVLLVVVSYVLLFLFLPRARRLDVLLTLLMASFALGKLTELGVPSLLTKLTLPVALLAVALAAWRHPTVSSRTPPAALLYFAIALASPLYVFTVLDRSIALAVKTQWILMLIVAFTVARKASSIEETEKILRALVLGALLASFVTAISLLIDPWSSFGLRGFRRFSPFGANPNQIGTVFALAGPGGVWLAMLERSTAKRLLLLSAAGLALFQGLLTCSRSVVTAQFLLLLAILPGLMKKPVMAVLSATLTLVLGNVFLPLLFEADLSRMGSFQSQRIAVFREYGGIFLERPFFGLMFSENEFWKQNELVGTHPHSTMLSLLYEGGFSLFLPFSILVGSVVAAAVRLRARFAASDPLVVGFLVSFLAVGLLHGVISSTLLYPTFGWAFAQAVAAFLTLSLGRRTRPVDYP